jgi:hypothetical protein
MTETLISSGGWRFVIDQDPEWFTELSATHRAAMGVESAYAITVYAPDDTKAGRFIMYKRDDGTYGQTMSQQRLADEQQGSLLP